MLGSRDKIRNAPSTVLVVDRFANHPRAIVRGETNTNNGESDVKRYDIEVEVNCGSVSSTGALPHSKNIVFQLQ